MLAAEMAREYKPDVILLDIMLPGKNGIDICKELSREASTSAIPVIIVSVKNDVHTKLSAFIAGAKRYITKPFGVEDIVNEVRKTLRQKELTSGVDHYRDKCNGKGDYGVFPTNFESMTEVCDKEI